MNPDLMITIAFGVWATLAWGTWGVLVVHSLRTERTKEADKEPSTLPLRTSFRSAGQSRQEPQANGGVRAAARRASRGGHRNKGGAAPRAGAGVDRRREA
jgi:hypothetical protein